MKNKFLIFIFLLLGLLSFFLLKNVQNVKDEFENENQVFDTTEIIEAKTPEEMVNVLNSSNFMITEQKSWNVIEPEDFLEKGGGSKVDALVFLGSSLHQKGYEVGILRYLYTVGGSSKTSAVLLLKDYNTPKHIFWGENGLNISEHGFSFEELFVLEEERLGIVITDYAAFLPANFKNLHNPKWIKR